MRRAALVVAACAALLAACSSDPPASASRAGGSSSCIGPNCGSEGSNAPAAATTTAPATTLFEVGQVVSNRGITLTVTKVSAPATIDMNESNMRPGSGYEKYTKTSAAQLNAKYIRIDTHVVNDAQVSLDLTCSLPITTKLVDVQNRNFDPIQDLYKLKGNPECNTQLQPGFESDMSYVYEIPASATVTGWAFQDSTNFSNLGTATWTIVRTPMI